LTQVLREKCRNLLGSSSVERGWFIVCCLHSSLLCWRREGPLGQQSSKTNTGIVKETLDKMSLASYYTHLGAASDARGLQELIAGRAGSPVSSVRAIEIVQKIKGKPLGCPISSKLITREEEQILVLFKRSRDGMEVAAVVIVSWLAFGVTEAAGYYSYFSKTVGKHGIPSPRG
jgi:hypothetical protein